MDERLVAEDFAEEDFAEEDFFGDFFGDMFFTADGFDGFLRVIGGMAALASCARPQRIHPADGARSISMCLMPSSSYSADTRSKANCR